MKPAVTIVLLLAAVMSKTSGQTRSMQGTLPTARMGYGSGACHT